MDWSVILLMKGIWGHPGLVTNCIIFCYLFTLKDQCKKASFCTDTLLGLCKVLLTNAWDRTLIRGSWLIYPPDVYKKSNRKSGFVAKPEATQIVSCLASVDHCWPINGPSNKRIKDRKTIGFANCVWNWIWAWHISDLETWICIWVSNFQDSLKLK